MRNWNWYACFIQLVDIAREISSSNILIFILFWYREIRSWVTFMIPVTVVLCQAPGKDTLAATSLLGKFTLAWLRVFSDSLWFCKTFKEKHMWKSHVHVKIKGSHTSTKAKHQPASDKGQRVAVRTFLKVRLSCREECAESAGPHQERGSLC